MKIISILSFLLLIVSCDTKRDVDKEIRDKITEFYDYSEVKDYQPLFYSAFDTITSSEIKTTGIVEHLLKARNRNGEINEFRHIFNVTIFKDIVVVIPKEI
ncbi:MAG: hypothetical protein ACPGSD_00175 [Flavobacteriales bacterium]